MTSRNKLNQKEPSQRLIAYQPSLKRDQCQKVK